MMLIELEVEDSFEKLISRDNDKIFYIVVCINLETIRTVRKRKIDGVAIIYCNNEENSFVTKISYDYLIDFLAKTGKVGKIA